jgi:AraC family transcriptional regulator
MGSSYLQGFAWYQQLPRGFSCTVSAPSPSLRAASIYTHRLPQATACLIDLCENPVLSMAIGVGGAIERTIEGRRERAALGCYDLTLTPAGVACDWHWQGTVLDIVDIHIPTAVLEQLGQEHGDFRGGGLNFKPTLALKDEGLSLLIRGLLHEAPWRSGCAMLHDTFTSHLVAKLLGREHLLVTLPGTRRSTLGQPALARVKDYIETHLAQDLCLDELAALVGVSRFHFLRLFKTTVGVTPHVYLSERRMVQAARLLRDSQAPVIEIAAACGFDDPSYFAARFRRHVGVTPMLYRRVERGEGG